MFIGLIFIRKANNIFALSKMRGLFVRIFIPFLPYLQPFISSELLWII